MNHSPYEFNPEDAESFARFVNIQTFTKGSEMMYKVCPYCHGTGKGNEKTFSINLKTGQFKCFRASCGVTGNMITLSKDFDFKLSGYAGDYYNNYKKEYYKPIQPKKVIEPKPPAIKFLESRGISKAIAERYEITVHKDHENWLLIPFFDEKSILHFWKCRKTDFDKTKDNAKEWFLKDQKDTRPIKQVLFGMKQCKDKTKLIVSEGEMDCMAIAEAGYENTVSVPCGAKGFTWLPNCWNWINSFEEVVVFGDYEKGHITLLDELSKRLKTKVKHVREEDYKDCKDANDILRKYGTVQIKQCVDNAINIPIRQVVDLADVRIENESDIKTLKTYIPSLDKMLYGGLPFGGITIVAAKSGIGKSTLASEFIAQAIGQNNKCFVYSGELRNEDFKKWFNFQIAGRDRITEYSNKWGDVKYKLSDVNNHNISEWYRDRCFIYDSNDISDEEGELTGLIELTEDVVMQYGVSVILIDNLMTAIDLEGGSGADRFEKQSLFVKKLARLAIKHNCLIILVAHKRKNAFSTDAGDEVMGSSDITNLASVVIGYDRGKADDNTTPDQRICTVSKNRLYGWVSTDTEWRIKLNYDKKSKRIFEENHKENEGFDFKWDKNGGFDDSEETPFTDEY